MVLGELGQDHGLPHLPEVPGRAPGAAMTGRALAMVVNPAAGLTERAIDLSEIQAASARCMTDAIRLIEALLESFVGV